MTVTDDGNLMVRTVTTDDGDDNNLTMVMVVNMTLTYKLMMGRLLIRPYTLMRCDEIMKTMSSAPRPTRLVPGRRTRGDVMMMDR